MHFDLNFTENVEIGAVALYTQEGLEVVEQDNFLEVRNLRSEEPRQWEFSLPTVDVNGNVADFNSVLTMWSNTERGLHSFNFTDFVTNNVYRVRFASGLQITAPAGHLRHLDTFTIREVLEVSPEPTVAPVISGTATVGSTLSVSNGTWSGSPNSYAVIWYLDGILIEGETAGTYEVQPGDGGHLIGASITATDAYGGSTITWAAERLIA